MAKHADTPNPFYHWISDGLMAIFFFVIGLEVKREMVFGGEKSLIPMYYSFVALTTLGYGNIVPVSPPARILAILEATLGQIYLTVLVARLVGLHIAHVTFRSSGNLS